MGRLADGAGASSLKVEGPPLRKVYGWLTLPRRHAQVGERQSGYTCLILTSHTHRVESFDASCLDTDPDAEHLVSFVVQIQNI